jgi:hypothetical protein
VPAKYSVDHDDDNSGPLRPEQLVVDYVRRQERTGLRMRDSMERSIHAANRMEFR